MKPKKKPTKQTIHLGAFELTSPVLRISDPCYDRDTWCAGSVSNAALGSWICSVVKVDEHDNWGNRCREIVACHSSMSGKVKWKELDIDVGVDSGQAGIFDDAFYKVDYTEDYIQVGRAEYDDRNFLRNKVRDIEMYREGLEAAKATKNIKLIKSYKDLLEISETMLNECRDNVANPEKTRDWYEVCCDKTLSDVGAGVIRNGVVSSSGDGDGSYTAYAVYDAEDRVIGVKIKF